MLGQIIEASNLPQDIQNYELQDREVKYLLPKYNPEIGDFQGLCETIGFIVVRGDAEEIFLNHGYEQLKSKVLHSTYRQKIPNSFCGTMFNCHKTLIECVRRAREQTVFCSNCKLKVFIDLKKYILALE